MRAQRYKVIQFSERKVIPCAEGRELGKEFQGKQEKAKEQKLDPTGDRYLATR